MKAIILTALTLASPLTFAGVLSGDYLCTGKIRNVEISIKYSVFVQVAKIELTLVNGDGTKAPYRNQEPKVVSMIRGDDGDYAYSSDDYVDLTIQHSEERPTQVVAFLKSFITNDKLAEFACSKR